jgi:hypothetical protein
VSRAPIDSGGSAVLVPDKTTFGGEHDLVTPPANGSPYELLVVSCSIYIRSIEKVDAKVERALDSRQRLSVVVTRTVCLRYAHAAQT